MDITFFVYFMVCLWVIRFVVIDPIIEYFTDGDECGARALMDAQRIESLQNRILDLEQINNALRNQIKMTDGK